MISKLKRRNGRIESKYLQICKKNGYVDFRHRTIRLETPVSIIACDYLNQKGWDIDYLNVGMHQGLEGKTGQYYNNESELFEIQTYFSFTDFITYS